MINDIRLEVEGGGGVGGLDRTIVGVGSHVLIALSIC